MSLFNRSAVDWSLSELRAGLAVLGQEIAERVEAGKPTDALHAMAVVLAEERDRRVGLHRAMESIMSPVKVTVDD